MGVTVTAQVWQTKNLIISLNTFLVLHGCELLGCLRAKWACQQGESGLYTGAVQDSPGVKSQFQTTSLGRSSPLYKESCR